jgi:putative membrane protein
MKKIPAILPLVFLAQGAVAHGLGEGGKPHDYHELWQSWEFDPFVIAGLAFAGGLYQRGVRRLWRATRVGGGVRRWEAASFAAGWLAIVVALVSPLHPWGRVLFSAHMTQHEVLMLVAAPLLVLGKPLVVFLWALPRWLARLLGAATKVKWWARTWRIVSGALVAWLIHMIALWMWHIPALFDATIESDVVHAAQHLSFLGSALLFWWAVMQGRQKALGYGLAVLYLFTTALHNGLLGALLTFTRSPWYPAYSDTTQSWGLTPLEDQQLGGLIMWVPAGVVYIIAGLALFAGWMRESENRVVKTELDALAGRGRKQTQA